MEEVTASYSDVFKGLGCMEGALHLELDTTVTPAIMPPRRVPLTLLTLSKSGRRPRSRRTRPRRRLCARKYKLQRAEVATVRLRLPAKKENEIK